MTDDNPSSFPIAMLNALWFQADGGAERYAEYLRRAAPLVAEHGGRLRKAYRPEQALYGDFDADLVFFVEWPSEAAFLAFTRDPRYQEIAHLRTEASRDSLLIRCRPATFQLEDK